MDARSFRAAPISAATVGWGLCLVSIAVTATAQMPQYRVTTRNFHIMAPTPQMAQQVAQNAEIFRAELARDWLGYELPPWQEKCPILVEIGPHAGGETTFAFPRLGEQPIGWQMKIFGPPDRVVDSVLPHEITHAIFATHFGRPLPRWADEGACTTVEHDIERSKNHRMLIDFLSAKPSRGIPFNQMFLMKQYPHDILPLYAQGYSLARFLIMQGGRKTFVKYLETGMQREGSTNDLAMWGSVTREFYGFEDLSDLQVQWLSWVKSGCPDLDGPLRGGAVVAVNEATQTTQPQAVQPLGLSAGTAQAMIAADAAVQAPSGESWYRRQMRLAHPGDPGQPMDASNVGHESTNRVYAPGSIGSLAKGPEGQSERPATTSHSSETTTWR